MPPPSCTVIPEASEAVCNPHTVLFDLPDANEAVCIPHHLIWPSRREQAVCIPHTALFKLFYPPHHLGGILSSNGKNKVV